MGIGESFKEFLGIGKKVGSAQTPDQAPQPVITPLNPTDVIQRPIDVATTNQQQVDQAPSSPSTEPKPAA